jgi:hypothetical protein
MSVNLIIGLITLFSTLYSVELFAYPQFIGHGYNSCLTCHYNPYGGGMLNDYGRALSANKVAARWFHQKGKSEEQISEESGFLYRKPSTTWLRTALKYRGLGLRKSHATANAENEWIHMVARAAVMLKFGAREQFLLGGNMDYAPAPRGVPNFDQPSYRSREHFIGWRFLPNMGIYAGLLDKVFGLRVPDHIAYSRTATLNTMNDQSHGVKTHLLLGNWEWGFQYYLGNLTSDQEVRQAGWSTMLEYTWSPTFQPGFSLTASESLFTRFNSFAFHQRAGFADGSSLITEIGQRKRTLLLTERETTARYGFLQGHFYFARGIYLVQTVEFIKNDLETRGSVLRLGPGLQVFPHQGFEFRVDLYNTRGYVRDGVNKDTWDLTVQVHLWL